MELHTPCQRSDDKNGHHEPSLISQAMAKLGAQGFNRAAYAVNGARGPSSTNRCPRCGKDVPPSMLLAHAKADEYLIHLIRKDHPEWVRPDGTCPRCTLYYRVLAKRTGV